MSRWCRREPLRVVGAKVSQPLMVPSHPLLNQRTRCSADPWVKESVSTRPGRALLDPVVAHGLGGVDGALDVVLGQLADDRLARRRPWSPGRPWPRRRPGSRPSARRAPRRSSAPAGCGSGRGRRAGPRCGGRTRGRSRSRSRTARPWRRAGPRACRRRRWCRGRPCGRSGSRTAPSPRWPGRSRSRSTPRSARS